MNNTRLIFDSIKQTQVSLPENSWRIIDTPHYFRLKNITCNGSNSFVFASANHNYFNKSLGLLLNTEQFVNYLQLENEDKSNLIISSLGYYLGCVPYQTAFNNFMIEDKGIVDYSHELTSCKMLDDLSEYLYNKDGKEILNEDNRQTIFSIIRGQGTVPNKDYLLHILNNKQNGLDIIKMNNIDRDCKYYGIEGGYDYDLPMSSAKVIDGKLMYSDKSISQLYELYKCSYKLERHIYNHRVIVGIDLMIQDIFKYCDKRIDFKNLLSTPKELMSFTNSFFSMIIDPCTKRSKFISQDAKLLIEKIYKRDFYKFVGEIQINKNLVHPEKITKYNIVSASSSSLLKEDDLILKRMKFSYGNSQADPLEKSSFYQHKTSKVTFINKEQYLLDRPHKFEEEIVRVYVKDKSKLHVALEAFRRFCSEEYLNLNHNYDKGLSAKKIYNDNIVKSSDMENCMVYDMNDDDFSKNNDFSGFLKLREGK